MIPKYCQNCGAVMSFDPTAQMVQCDSCGTIWYADEDASVKKERLQNEREKQRMQHERDSRADEFFYREKIIKEMEDRNRRKAVFWGKMAAVFVVVVLLVIGAGFAINSVIHKNDIKIKTASSGFVGQNYKAVEQMLKNKGYYNIKTNPVPELDKNQQEQMETVSSVVINGEAKYSRGTWFPEDAEIIINYCVLDPKHENDIQISASMNNLSGSDYISVVNRLQQDGFNNIEVWENCDSKLLSPDIGKVESVYIDGDRSFSAGRWVNPDIKVAIYYHSFSGNGNGKRHVADLTLEDVMLELEPNDLIKQPFEKVEYQLRENGFECVTCIGLEDLTDSTSSRLNKVESVTYLESSLEKGKVYHRNDEIIIVYHSLHVPEGSTTAPKSAQKFCGTNYEEAIELLKKVGFINIKTENQEDVRIANSKEIDKIVSIRIDGKDDFEKEDVFPKDAEIRITVHKLMKGISVPYNQKHFIGEQYQTVVAELKELGFGKIRLVGDKKVKNRNDSGLFANRYESVEEITIAGNSKFEKGSVFRPTEEVIVTYYDLIDGIEVPDDLKKLRGLDYQQVQNQMKSAGFTNISIENSYELKNSDDAKVGMVKSISIDGEKSFAKGDIFEANAKIIITKYAVKQ